jgi:hypothetical protein
VGVFNFLVSIDGGPWANNGTATTLIQAFSSGWHTVAVCANDTYGNNATAIVTFLVSITPPSVWFIAPVDGFVTNTSLVPFSWNGTGNANLVSFSLSVDGGAWTNLNLSTQAVLNLPDGVHAVLVRVIDLNGDPAQNITYVTVDTTPPVLVATIPPAIVGQFSILSWTASDATTNVTQVVVYVDGAKIYSGTGSSCSLGAYSAAGNHSVEVLAFDYAGNVANVTGTLVVSSVSSPGSNQSSPSNPPQGNSNSNPAANPPPSNVPIGVSITISAIAAALVVGATLTIRRKKGRARNPGLYYPKLAC